MELIVNFSDDEPLYRLVYIHIRALIQSGDLPHNSKLPSIRSLMQQLNISKTTVETAYHMLIEEGYVRCKERSGLFVVNPTNLNNSMSTSSSDHVTTQAFKPLTGSHEKNLIDFNLLAVDGDSFPLRTWKSIVAEAISLHNHNIHHYGDPRGEYGLRQSVAQYLHKSRGVVCSPEQIVIGNGISYSIQLLYRLLEETTVGIEKSGIAQVRSIFTQSNFQLIPVSLHEVEQFDNNKIHNLYLTPSHRSTGDPMPYADRLRLLQWAKQNDGYLIEDDYNGELYLYGKPIPSLQSLDRNGVVIYIGTFSKAFTPALRMNYMILPEPLLEKLPSLDKMLSPPSRFDQWAMELFISRGHWYRHLRRTRKIYRVKHQSLVQMLHTYLPNSVQIDGGKSGLHVELSIKSHLNTTQIIQLAREQGVLVYSSQDADIHSSTGVSKVYLGFGGISEQEMERGVQLLSNAWSTIAE